jgi:hypothetical protein
MSCCHSLVRSQHVRLDTGHLKAMEWRIPLDSTCFSTKQLWIPHGSTIVTQFDTPFCISNAIRHPDNPKKGHSSTHMRPHHSALHISRGSVRGRCRCKQKLRCHCSQLDKTSENSTGGPQTWPLGNPRTIHEFMGIGMGKYGEIIELRELSH